MIRLLYLSDETVEGGELRAFPQRVPVRGICGSHSKDLQIGWLEMKGILHVQYLTTPKKHISH